MIKNIIEAILILLMSLVGCTASGDKNSEDVAKATYTEITQEAAKEMMKADDGHVIVDVRRQDEYDEGHIPGAILIPNESIESTKPDALPDLKQIILVYCRSGRRSKEAAQKLADMGYKNVYEFGGIIDWTGEIVKDVIDFDAIAEQAELRRNKATVQYEKEDYTRLSEPVDYNILMLGYTHVTYEELDFRMTDFDRKYLEAVALNFEKTVERLTDHNIDITIDLYFVDDETKLTQYPGEEWLYLAKETVQKDIDKYDIDKKYDSVLTAVETAGDENAGRNTGKSGYGVNYVMLGLMTAGIENGLGYSTFDLGKPIEGTYPLADPEIPSLYATAVAVHEWMHQLEFIGNYLGIEYPDTHAYQGNIPGYRAYTADLNNYDYFEFYELVLAGKLPFTSNDTVKHVGMYPDMWPLAKRGVVLDKIGTFTITNEDGEYLAGDVVTCALSVSKEESKWQICYGRKNRFILLCDENPSLRVDLGNAWDVEGNSIGVWEYTGYDDAQSWLLTKNSDGTYYIRTPYPSGSALAVDKPGAGAYLSENGTKWTFKRVSGE